ncbi:NAD(P)-binding protein [Bimuria novae-zelandiae CBS 107.79]|uniref:NAD(P)-binding protein n=1 Tax=Bimuria novae-zelandiae CBS 107.79 TaxID=1447943 RepID=A0A6A5VNZ1_9PLEO|nr:NAD(P)-binding protein [Bimuria novae-zelandiae CBS 107.79]
MAQFEPTDLPLHDGKIILITGGASGIGLSLTQQASQLGAKVLVADLRTTPEFDSFAQGNPNILYVQADVSHWPDFLKLFDACEKKWGDVPDAYGICAGVFEPPFSNFWHDPEQDKGYAEVDINVSHPIKLTRLAIKKSLQNGKRASVCIIASIGGISGNIAAPLYCATKHAIVGFVKSMTTSESFTGVKITTILPGLVYTPLIDEQKKEQYSVAEENSLKPWDVAGSMLDLIQKKEYGCGMVFEISLGGTRVIPEWNVEPPAAKGTGQDKEELAAGLKALLAPIHEKLKSEMKGAKV